MGSSRGMAAVIRWPCFGWRSSTPFRGWRSFDGVPLMAVARIYQRRHDRSGMKHLQRLVVMGG